MVISTNPNANLQDFELLISQMLKVLHQRSAEQTEDYQKLLAQKLEDEVYSILQEISKNTVFENTIQLISGQRFPDIIAHKYFGIEVKTTKTNQWTSTGGSVAEGTRVEGVERIFMLFGKMYPPIQFICKPYEECLSDVVVTHSPRYQINMQLKPEETFFAKIGIPYDELRQQTNPIKTILNYYKTQLQEGEEVWYIDNSSKEIVAKFWNSLDKHEKSNLITQAFILFPELMGNSSQKFNRFVAWLNFQKSILCHNTRDLFTSGGKQKTKNNILVPAIVFRFIKHLPDIPEALKNIDNNALEYYWNVQIPNNLTEKQLEQWKWSCWADQITPYINQQLDFNEESMAYIQSIIQGCSPN